MRNLFPVLLLSAALLWAPAALAQSDAHKPKLQQGAGVPRPLASTTGYRPDIPPRFPGDQKAMQKFLQDNLKYPDAAADHQVSGHVTVQFMVKEDGSLADFGIVGDTLGYGCEQEALRVAKLMPNWAPARRRTQPVATVTLITMPFGASPTLDDPKHRHH